MPELPRYVLLVDDDPVVLRLVATALAPYPDLRSATSGDEALRRVREASPELIVPEDEPAAIRTPGQTLAGLGLTHFADDAGQALEQADRLQPDLILLDAGLAGTDGIEVCSRLKAQPALRHVPVALLSRSGDAASEVPALDAGAAEYIARPCTARVLQAPVRRLLEPKRRTDAQLREVAVLWRRVGDARVAEIVQAASDATLSFDAEGSIVLANEAASRLFPAPDGRPVGTSIEALLDTPPADLQGGGTDPRRLVLSRGNGRHVPVEAAVWPSGEGTGRLTTEMVRPIADRELLEAERGARMQMEARVLAQRRMLSFIAHEAGHPLTGLVGFVELMAGDALHPLPPAQAARLGHVATSTRHLQALMEDLMTLGRSEQSDVALDVASVGVPRAVEDAAAAVSGLAARAGVAVTCRPSDARARVGADAKRLHQCRLNLLTHAIKSNRAGGTVEIDGEAGRFVGIAVRDDGPGMDEAQVRGLFEPFDRLGGQPGAGIGLVITRHLVLALHGRLTVQSSAGSRFTLSMPVAEGAADPCAAVCRLDALCA